MISSSQLKSNLCFIKSKIRNATQQFGRTEEEIKIVAVTKTLPIEALNMAKEEGFTSLGESRIKEAEKKIIQFNYRQNVDFHLIGHLQSNKVRKAINLFDIIQTVDSMKLLNRINQISQQENKIQKIFLQVNAGKDPQKKGFINGDIYFAAEETVEMSHISLKGIMTIPPQNISTRNLSEIYKKTRKIKEKIQESIERDCNYLSMGMSSDFETAIKEGATHIRIGTALFGKRQN